MRNRVKKKRRVKGACARSLLSTCRPRGDAEGEVMLMVQVLGRG